MTFSIYNSTNLLLNTTKNISGLNNYSIFNYNFTNQGEYYYNCISFNNESNSSQTENYTITYDITKPYITLISPENNSNTTTKTNDFEYSETETNKDSCILTINNENYSEFTQTLDDGIYSWNISCTDKANNTNTSETRKLEIYTETTTTNLETSTTPTVEENLSASPETNTISLEEIKQGIIRELSEDEELNFQINSINHELKINSISSDKVNITLSSNPINFLLIINESKKIDFNDDKIYDLKIKLLNIESSKANIEIKEINETIPMKHIFQENQTIENKTQFEEQPKQNEISFIKIIEFMKKVLCFLNPKNTFINNYFNIH
jgi:hypothetical protein